MLDIFIKCCEMYLNVFLLLIMILIHLFQLPLYNLFQSHLSYKRRYNDVRYSPMCIKCIFMKMLNACVKMLGCEIVNINTPH